jgi:hypothetical protein
MNKIKRTVSYVNAQQAGNIASTLNIENTQVFKSVYLELKVDDTRHMNMRIWLHFFYSLLFTVCALVVVSL